MSLQFYASDQALIDRLCSVIAIEYCPHLAPSEQHWFFQKVDQRLTLSGIIEQQPFQLTFDLLSGHLNYRRQHGGGRKEPLAKAIGLKHNASPFVIDATAGMGREALLLAAMGCRVIAIERQPVIFLLLQDAIERLQYNANESLDLTLLHRNSGDYLATLDEQDRPEVIYLDPMFPERKKSAAVKKEMRIFKQLAGTDPDATALLEQALKTATKRVVVKRPSAADPIGDDPNFAITSKKHRFDVYLT